MSTKQKTIFAQRLNEFLKKENISQTELGRIIGMPPDRINKYVNGTLKIPFEIVLAMHQKLLLNFNWFYAGTGKRKLESLGKKELMTDLSEVAANQRATIAMIEGLTDRLSKIERIVYDKTA